MIHIISMWHNEEIIAPLFIEHYKRADKITILLDDCTDSTRDYLSGCEVREIKTGGLDDILKAHTLSCVANNSNADMRIVVDSDEFIYPLDDDYEMRPDAVAEVPFWEVFRHQEEADIDYTKPPLQQRIHGNPNKGQCFGQNHFTKPIVFGPEVEVNLMPGNHSLYPESYEPRKLARNGFEGAHWAMADHTIAIQRRINKKHRMSQVNYQNGLTSHDWHITREQIIATCMGHRYDPKVIEIDRERF